MLQQHIRVTLVGSVFLFVFAALSLAALPLSPYSGSSMAAAGAQAAKSPTSPSGVELPEGTKIIGKWEDGTEMKLKPEEAVALLFVSDIVGLQISCHLDFHRYCSIQELVNGIKTKMGLEGLSRDPAQDVNYSYSFKATGGETYQIAAVPRRSGLGGWLFVNGASLAEYYYNPIGPATTKDKKIGGTGFNVQGKDFVR
jgi:hypothetical protein